MRQYALNLPLRLSDLAHEVLVEDVDAIVDDMLDEAGATTLVFTTDLLESDIRERLGECLPGEFTLETVC
jgi:hypothetical protein